MKKFSFVFVLLLAASVFAKDFSDFEQSLFSNPESENKSSEDSTGSVSDFESELASRPSELTPVYRGREELLNAIQQKDKDGVRSQIAALDELNSSSLLTLDIVEKECAYVELKMFDDLLNMLVDYYKTIYDTTRHNAQMKHFSSEEDVLVLYVKKQLSKRDTNHSFYYEVKDEIESSDLSLQKQKKLEIMMLLRDAYRERAVGDTLAVMVLNYKAKYPEDPDAAWMEKSIYSPLEKMDQFSYSLKMRKVHKEDVIKEKLYTGGIGLNLGFPILGFNFGSEYIRKDLFEPGDGIINVELYIQISRLVFLGEIVNSGIEGVFGYGFGLGFVAYDSRYLKIRPYISIDMSGIDVKPKKSVPRYDIIVGESEYDTEGEFNTYTLGASIDYKFGTPYFLLSDKKLVSFALVGKFGLSYLSMDNRYAHDSGINGFGSLSLGVFFW